VLDQPEQVGTGRSQRPADVVLRKSVDFPEHGLTSATQVAVQACFASDPVMPDSLSAARGASAPEQTEKQRYCGNEIIGNAPPTQRASPALMTKIKRPPCTRRHLRGTFAGQSSAAVSSMHTWRTLPPGTLSWVFKGPGCASAYATGTAGSRAARPRTDPTARLRLAHRQGNGLGRMTPWATAADGDRSSS
jgi:hypothetical protein